MLRLAGWKTYKCDLASELSSCDNTYKIVEIIIDLSGMQQTWFSLCLQWVSGDQCSRPNIERPELEWNEELKWQVTFRDWKLRGTLLAVNKALQHGNRLFGPNDYGDQDTPSKLVVFAHVWPISSKCFLCMYLSKSILAGQLVFWMVGRKSAVAWVNVMRMAVIEGGEWNMNGPLRMLRREDGTSGLAYHWNYQTLEDDLLNVEANVENED